MELAIALPVLLLLAFGCAELGRGVAAYLIVGAAARAGAQYGATHGYSDYTYASWQNQVIQEAKNEVQGNNPFDVNRLSVSVSSVPQPGGFNLATVTAYYTFDPITHWPGLPKEIVVSHSVGMRRFR